MLVLALKFSRYRDDERRPENRGAWVVLLGANAPRKRNRETIQTFETRRMPVGLSISPEQAPATSDQRGSPRPVSDRAV